MVNKNVDIQKIMKTVGHTEYKTTERYIHQNVNDIKDSIFEVINDKKR